MLKRLKNLYLRKVKHFSTNDINILNWRKLGIKIGSNCHIYSSLPNTRDCSLLSIGNNVTISGKCVLLCHDASINVPSEGKYTDLLGKIDIGDNCFIGYASIILPGVKLANNIIVGAGSVVTKSFLTPGVVIAGNPARVISTAKDFFEKYKNKGFNLDNLSKREVEKLIYDNPEKLISK